MKAFMLKLYYKFLKLKDNISILFNKFLDSVLAPPKVHSTDETLELLVKKDYSASRYGDGEFSLMNGKSLLFQPYMPELATRLREIITSNSEKHIVCIPNVFKDLEWCVPKSKNYWIKYLNQNRGKIYRLIDRKKEYYDSLVTRLYIDYKDKSKAEVRFFKIQKLWSNKEIVIVEGTQSRLGLGNDLFKNAISIERILCPSQNAFEKYGEILSEVKKQGKEKLILIALGPTATVLSFDLSSLGYQAIDIGHIDIEYEWFLQKAQKKSPVKNKYIGEIPNGTVVGEIEDLNYENQVISKIR